MSTSRFLSLQGLLTDLIATGGFDRHLHRVKVLGGGDGILKAIMKVEKDDANISGQLHGAMSALLVDAVSTVGLMTHPLCKSRGVTVSLNMTYLKPIPVGQDILIESTTDKLGFRLAFLSVDIRNSVSRALIARGTHTKFVGQRLTE